MKGTKDPRVDSYILKSAEFAKPILIYIRNLVHQACPDVKENIKWGFPHFDHHGIMCSMASFKNHATFGFWKASLISDPGKLLLKVGVTSMGQFGKLRHINDLPNRNEFLRMLVEAVKLNESGTQVIKKSVLKETRTLEIPSFFLDELNKNPRAHELFEGFSYTNKKDYVEWVTEAKTEATRLKRLSTAMEWMNEGKIRNWKYVK
jgi:uncharacterized protein YdeI (YjbR/CyaY-like superfamily)